MFVDSVIYWVLFSVFVGVLFGFLIVVFWFVGNFDVWCVIIDVV